MLNYSWINRILFFCAICLSGIMSTKAQETYLDVIINYTPTNFHYGDLNGDLKSYKDSKSGLQAGIAYQKGITPPLFRGSGTVLHDEGWRFAARFLWFIGIGAFLLKPAKKRS